VAGLPRRVHPALPPAGALVVLRRGVAARHA
jgi:hypothetical protein